MSLIQWQCFRRFFCQANDLCYKAMYTDLTNQSLGVTRLSKLVGMDTLWSIALSAQQPVVAEQARQLFVTLHLRSDCALPLEDRQAAVRAIIDRLLQHLASPPPAASASAPVSGSNDGEMRNVLRMMLTVLVRSVRGEFVRKPAYAASTVRSLLMIYFS
jgi:hypothetical protein